MPRGMTVKNVFDRKARKLVSFNDPKLQDIFGNAELKGIWEIYGVEKNGKTWFALQLAKDLSACHKVVYISAEEGVDLSFQEALHRAGVTTAHKILFTEYLTLAEIIETYSKPRSADIIFIDNMTMYVDDFKQYGLINFINALPGKLIIFLCHEERKEPYPAISRLALKLSKVYVHVCGLSAYVVSRFSAGGEIIVDEGGASLFWGEKK